MGLTPKNKLFIEEYIKNNFSNATAAYRKIYENASYETAKVQASKILKKPEAKEFINGIQEQAYREAGITAERIALHLANIAFDKEKLYATTPQMKALDLLQKQLGLQTQKFDASVNQEQTIEVKIED